MATQRHAIEIGAALRRHDFIADAIRLRVKCWEYAVPQIPERRVAPRFLATRCRIFAGIGREDIFP
jgi:hypothetical protein